MKGIFEILFPNTELTRNDSLLDGCKSCNYKLTFNLSYKKKPIIIGFFLYERIFTIVRKINYNEVRFTFLEKEGDGMERMFRVLGFWTGIFSVMFYVGDMHSTALLF